MSTPAISVESLGKKYKIGLREKTHDTLRDAITSVFSSPLRRLRALGERTTAAEEFWALRDISFEVQPGEVVGIIGRNGAGKSTLLKILSRITEPTEGVARIRGRVGSLLEVGTGFHPELTGRENVYLNGAILGMKKAEIDANFDEIVAFAEVDKFLDTPVKRYSSGMRVRLAFAVAAHLEPEILIIDEVLAVGDAAFQRKCLGKMSDVSSAGRTVLFVSHNLTAVENLCSRVVLLKAGQLEMDESASDAIAEYARTNEGAHAGGLAYGLERELFAAQTNAPARIVDAAILSASGELAKTIHTGDALTVRVWYEMTESIPVPAFVVQLRSALGQEIFRLSTMPISGFPIEALASRGHVDLLIEALPVTAGLYSFDLGIVKERREWVTRLE